MPPLMIRASRDTKKTRAEKGHLTDIARGSSPKIQGTRVCSAIFKRTAVDRSCLYFPLSRLHFLAALRLAEFSYVKVHNVVARSSAI